MKEEDITIRRASPGDGEALAEFAARLFRETFGPLNDPADMEAHLNTHFSAALQRGEIEAPGVITLLAETPGRMAGFAQVRRNSMPESAAGQADVEIWRFYVDPCWHGQGLAAKLMETARKAAVEMGGRGLWLGVWERNPRAISFYKKCGFTPAGSHAFMLGRDRQTDLVLTAPLV